MELRYFFSMCATRFVIFVSTNPYIKRKSAQNDFSNSLCCMVHLYGVPSGPKFNFWIRCCSLQFLPRSAIEHSSFLFLYSTCRFDIVCFTIQLCCEKYSTFKFTQFNIQLSKISNRKPINDCQCGLRKLSNYFSTVYALCLSPSSFPTARTRIHTLTFVCLFVWFLFLFFFRTESNKFFFFFCDRWLNWMDFLCSDYHAGRFRFNPLGEIITHGQSNQEKLVVWSCWQFLIQKFIAGWRFKTFMSDKTSYSETLPLPSRTRRTAAKNYDSQEKGIIGTKCHASSGQRLKCKGWNDKWQTHIGYTHFIAKSLVVLARYVILNLDFEVFT